MTDNKHKVTALDQLATIDNFLIERYEGMFGKKPKHPYDYTTKKETPYRRMDDGYLNNHSAILIVHKFSVTVAVVEGTKLFVGGEHIPVPTNLVWVNLHDISKHIRGALLTHLMDRGVLTPFADHKGRLDWHLNYGRHTRWSTSQDTPDAHAVLCITGDKVHINFYSFIDSLHAIATTVEEYAYYCDMLGIPYDQSNPDQMEAQETQGDDGDGDAPPVLLSTPITRQRVLESEFEWKEMFSSFPELKFLSKLTTLELYPPENTQCAGITANIEFDPVRFSIGGVAFWRVKTMEEMAVVLSGAGFVPKSVVHVERYPTGKPITPNALDTIGWTVEGIPYMFTSLQRGYKSVSIHFNPDDITEFEVVEHDQTRGSRSSWGVRTMAELRDMCIAHGIIFNSYTFDPFKHDYFVKLGWVKHGDRHDATYSTMSKAGDFGVVVGVDPAIVRIVVAGKTIRDLTGRVESMRTLHALVTGLSLRWNYHEDEDSF